MSREDWFRRSTWTEADRVEFNTRLKRTRSGNKAQYVRIQALHLAQAGQHDGAVELLDRMFADFPDKIQLAQAHAQKADSLAKLGQIDAAIDEYRAALQAERDFPGVKTDAWLVFAWYVVEKQLTNYYGEVLQVLNEFRDEQGLKFPAIEYRYFALRSLVASARGEKADARTFAKKALVEAEKDHSGLRYHPTVGLVGSERDRFDRELKALAGS